MTKACRFRQRRSVEWIRSARDSGRSSARNRDLVLEPIASPEYPPYCYKTGEQEGERHPQTDRDTHIGNLEERPAEATDEIDDRIEQGDGLPGRRQHADGIEATAEKGERRDDQERDDLQLLEAVRPDPDDETEQAECHGGEHQE